MENGQIVRAIAEMKLARSEGSRVEWYYSMSAQIRKQRNEYYAILENTQKGDLDIKDWLKAFLSCMQNALSQDADGRDTQDLIAKGLVVKGDGGSVLIYCFGKLQQTN